MPLLSRLLSPTRSRAGGQPRMDDAALANAWQIISLLLRYPEQSLLAQADVLADVAAELPAPVADPLTSFLGDLAGSDLRTLQSEFVDTFDVTRRCCLYLTYFTCGDTRKRGVALVRFKQRYRTAGVKFDAASSEELPDHVCVVLDFGAQHDVDTAWKLLLEHRAGVEMLRMALADRDSRWLPVVQALVATLPALQGSDQEQVRALIEQGPPSEDVGLDMTPYGMDPELYSDPRATSRASLPFDAHAALSTDAACDHAISRTTPAAVAAASWQAAPSPAFLGSEIPVGIPDSNSSPTATGGPR